MRATRTPEETAAIGRLTNWQRKRWADLGYPLDIEVLNRLANFRCGYVETPAEPTPMKGSEEVES